jgi:hypothetical protein
LYFWAGYSECNEFFDSLKLFEDVDMDCSFPMRCYMLHMDSWFKSYEVLKISANFEHVVSHCQCNKICPKLPKFAKICPKTIRLRNFEMPPKIEILLFFKKKNSMCRRSTRVCTHRLNFQYDNFLYVFFIVQKQPLYVNFSIPPSGK